MLCEQRLWVLQNRICADEKTDLQFYVKSIAPVVHFKLMMKTEKNLFEEYFVCVSWCLKSKVARVKHDTIIKNLFKDMIKKYWATGSDISPMGFAQVPTETGASDRSTGADITVTITALSYQTSASLFFFDCCYYRGSYFNRLWKPRLCMMR